MLPPKTPAKTSSSFKYLGSDSKAGFSKREDRHKAGLAGSLEEEVKARPQVPHFMCEDTVRIPEKSRPLNPVF